ncbi:MAG: L-aspartate oxidase [Ardenticatenales bacterium]|nr:L-aspartate oxidase [Ardenticatenales bacterium]
MGFVNTIHTDVIVVGSGLAGLYTALQAAPHARVALLSKGTLSVSNSMWAQGGISAALAPDDSPHLHLEDTLVAGRDLCSTRAVEILVQEGPARIRHLQELGVPFDYENGELALALEGGHRRRRIVHADGVATGATVTGALSRIVRSQRTISLREQMEVIEILQSDGVCCGVLAYHPPSRAWWRFLAPATILASGGAAGLYARTTNPAVTRGDGMALAYRAGAAVADLEFVQFHPTALVSETGGGFLLSEAVRGEGAHLLNTRGERFMPRYHDLAELAPRDLVSRANFREMAETGSDHVLLDLSPLDPQIIRHHFALLYERCREYGIDLLKEPVPVAPAAHYVMGGVLTDVNGTTSLPGLFACGEVACTGVQGANRLASNSLLECLVFGRRSALAALHLAEASGNQSVGWRSSPAGPTHRATAEADGLVRERLGALLWQQVGLVRNAQGLQHCLDELDPLDQLPASASVQNSLLVARLIATAAQMREESRGGHFREDFSEEAAAWRKRLVFQQGQEPTLIDLEAHDLILSPTPLAVPA